MTFHQANDQFKGKSLENAIIQMCKVHISIIIKLRGHKITDNTVRKEINK